MLVRVFHNLWILLQKIKCKTESSTCDLWIFPQPVDFSAKNLNMTWTDKDLKKKENKRKRKGGGNG